MSTEDRIHAVIDPIVDDLGLELVDLVWSGGRLKVTIDHPSGLDTEMLTRAIRLISHEMDLADPISSTYTLEVSSPGVERPLRTPAHFIRSIGEQVSLKLKPNEDNLRRIRGSLVVADDDLITVEADDRIHTVGYDDIAKARTVFDWGPAPKPGKGPSKTSKTSKTSRSKTKQTATKD